MVILVAITALSATSSTGCGKKQSVGANKRSSEVGTDWAAVDPVDAASAHDGMRSIARKLDIWHADNQTVITLTYSADGCRDEGGHLISVSPAIWKGITVAIQQNPLKHVEAYALKSSMYAHRPASSWDGDDMGVKPRYVYQFESSKPDCITVTIRQKWDDGL